MRNQTFIRWYFEPKNKFQKLISKILVGLFGISPGALIIFELENGGWLCKK